MPTASVFRYVAFSLMLFFTVVASLALGLVTAVVSTRVRPGSSPALIVAAFVVVAGLLYLLSSRLDQPRGHSAIRWVPRCRSAGPQ